MKRSLGLLQKFAFIEDIGSSLGSSLDYLEEELGYFLKLAVFAIVVVGASERSCSFVAKVSLSRN